MDSKVPNNKLRWACRRGMLELDMFLLPFFDEVYPTLTLQEQSCFEALLSESDTQLQAWLLNQGQPEDLAAGSLILKIQQYAQC